GTGVRSGGWLPHPAFIAGITPARPKRATRTSPACSQRGISCSAPTTCRRIAGPPRLGPRRRCRPDCWASSCFRFDAHSCAEAARALGLAVPPSILLRADEVIGYAGNRRLWDGGVRAGLTPSRSHDLRLLP